MSSARTRFPVRRSHLEGQSEGADTLYVEYCVQDPCVSAVSFDTPYSYHHAAIDGRQSTGPEGVPLWHTRRLVGGDHVYLPDSIAPLSRRFSRDAHMLQFELEVCDTLGLILSSFDTVTVVVRENFQGHVPNSYRRQPGWMLSRRPSAPPSVGTLRDPAPLSTTLPLPSVTRERQRGSASVRRGDVTPVFACPTVTCLAAVQRKHRSGEGSVGAGTGDRLPMRPDSAPKIAS